ncbi:MAG TPA: hypothetical protein VFZ22_07250 [Pyrinomonadaceae bacterium]|nr:hypothetical protein [Pyrinomonadaceae bacterium]
MDDKVNEPGIQPEDSETKERSDRRDFLRSLGKWSTAAIAAILLTESTPSNEASAWPNRRGSLDGRGGGGSWMKRRGW